MDRDQPTLTERVERLERDFYAGGEPVRHSGCEDVISGQRSIHEDFPAGGVEGRSAPKSISKTEMATALQEIMDRIVRSTGRVSESASRIEEIGDRIFGALPQQGSTGDKERDPEGMFEHTLHVLDRLDHSLEWLQRVTTRIERV
jgi:hypothetical protein